MTQRRLRAGKMFMVGTSQVEVARALGVSRMTASRWAAAWREDRWDGLRGPGRAGPRPKLSDEQLGVVDKVLANGPEAYGLPAGSPWTVAKIGVMIEEVTGVALTTPGVASLLRQRLGWTHERPGETSPDSLGGWVRVHPLKVAPPAATAATVDRLLRRVEHSPG